ncbi:type I polyketide synthase [Leucothrix arctica]|uniref:Beta-ketoacyl synthase n=1 Tax=Leucothrix arctica TaxID=1481894 RepID=A0A317CL60_9GAMM|nr:type I polyketide synthase [Leucothrix arctica]PWQ99246.1 beta-ketoacyl synthase [Leucothrix arctica]
MSTLSKQISQLSPLKIAMAAQQLAPKMSIVNAEPIAIVGMGCRLPGGVDSPEKYWELLKEGKDAVSEMNSDRWDFDAHFDKDPTTPGKMSVRHAGFIDNVDKFDAQFFGISPREAAVLDPQQRLLMEVSWEAIENAGIVPSSLHNSATGVYIGITTSEYEKLCLQSNITDNNHIAYMGTGNDTCAAAGRLSYSLGLTGPSLSVNTACSSSLVAIHLACDSLRQRTSNMALAGGVNLTLIPDIYTVFSKAGMLSPDGRCKSFDASANGYVRGEGCGVLVLKRLSDAVADGDNILSIIRGSAVNQDGRSSGLTVPNGPSQQAVIRQALDNSGVLASQVGYVEAHGTGTSLGDPIEVGALGEVFREGRENPLLIGSAKTNIGHLESGAGVAGMIKTVLSLQHAEIPPNLHFKNPSPHIAWDDLPIKVVTERTPWPTERRIAGVSSFGYSGTNAHFILEAAPETVAPKTNEKDRSTHVLTLSTRTEEALSDIASSYAHYIAANPEASLADICASANTRRTQFAYSLAVSASTTETLAEQLTAFSNGDNSNVVTGSSLDNKQAKAAFLFTGQGSQYVNMGRELFDTQPTFRNVLEQCDALLKPYLEHSLLDVMYSDRPNSAPEGLINDTAYTQPALFAIEYALATLWQSWGVKPEVMLGHSVGEYAAACLAGVFSLEDALKLIAMRGKLMQALPRDGGMMAIRASSKQVTQAIANYTDTVSIAAINGSNSIVISGAQTALDNIADTFKSENISTRALTVSHAFHSPLMQPMLAEFAELANSIHYAKPSIKIVSTLTAALVSEEMASADYWVKHVSAAVNFKGGIEVLGALNCTSFIEIGAQPVLLGMAQHCIQPEGAVWAPSLRNNKDDWQQITSSLAEISVKGINVNWQGFDKDYARNTLILPNYPFQRQRHWIPQSAQADSRSSDALRPMVDRMVHSSLIKETILETSFSLEALPFLKDHTVFEEYVVPGASHLSVILSGADLLGMPSCQLEDVIFPGPLVLPEDQPRLVQAVLSPEDDATMSFQLISTSPTAPEQEAQTHATGRLANADSAHDTVSLSSLQSRCQEVLSPESLYQTAADQFIEFGPSFRWITQLSKGDGEALAQFTLPESIGSLDGYPIHPGLLDACLQTAGVTLDESASTETLLPFTLKTLNIGPMPTDNSWWCHVVQVGATTWDIQLFNDEGEVLLSIDGFEMRKAPRDAMLQRQLADWLYDIDWQAKATTPETLPEQAGRWLIFADSNGLGEQLAAELHEQNQATILVYSGNHYSTTERPESINETQVITINAQESADYERMIDEAFKQSGTACLGSIYLWSTERHESVETLLSDAQSTTVSATYAVQAIIRSQLNAPLYLVTQGSQAVNNETGYQLASASIWGFGRSLAIEQPSLTCTCIDLDQAEQNVAALLTELSSTDQEDQVAWRAGTRYVARLAKLTDHTQQLLTTPEGPFRVQLDDYGSADELRLVPITRRVPEAAEVEIEVAATALNFRDVLNSLGMLKDYYAEVLGIERAQDVPLGFECAGTVIAVGPDVTGLKIGDQVIANTEGSFASYVTVDSALVARKPANIPFEAAAGIPTAFLTAYYGLKELAQLKAGDKILIQSAAGGVGQAAVQLAQAAGAEIYATASPAKWNALKAQGIKHVMNSRTLDFADEVLRLTDNQGVDVVLNSLNGDFINKSFDVLRKGGRFVEIGKIGVWSQEEATAYRSDATYLPFDLGEVTGKDLGLMTRMLSELVTQFESGILHALPQTTFPIEQVANAYRYMQQTKHIGKVILTYNAEPAPAIKPDANYIVTGGLGGLGLQVAQQLADQGARHLTLSSRSGANSDAAKQLLADLDDQGVNVSVVKADASNAADVATLLATAQKAAPVRGIIHAAGVIDDASILKQTDASIAKVMGPKVQGALNLHTQSQALQLDHFICFSSIASLMGSPGQTNYAAANAVIDSLMQQRQALGLPGMSINWGPWDETGMAADMSFDGEGLEKIKPDLGLQTLNNLMQLPLHQSPAQVGVFPMNWAMFMQQFPEDQQPPFVSLMARQSMQGSAVKSKAKSGTSDILVQLKSSSGDEQKTMLINYISEQLLQVLGLDSDQSLPANQPWNELGLDSLMTVELKNRLDRSLRVSVPIETIMQEATTLLIADMIIDSLANVSLDTAENEATNEGISAAQKHMDALNSDVEMLALIPQTYTNVEEQRDRQVLINGQWRSDFASCNYLGMDLHQDVIDSIPAALDKWGVHPSWTRAVASPGLYPELEQELADLVGAPKTLIFPSIHLLHMGVLPLLAGFGGVILKDNSAHHSIYEACLRCQADGIEWTEFAHNDLDALEEKLKRYRPDQNKIIAIDGVYSMSGEFPPLPEMSALAKKYNAIIYLDDAHGIGVIGENPTEEMPYGYGGGGVVKYYGMDYEADRIVYVGGLSKSFSSYGSFVTCFDQAMKSRLSLAGPFVFSGPSPVASLASALAGLKVNRKEGDQMRERVYQLTRKLVSAAKDMGYEVDNEHNFPIVGVVIGNVDEVTEACDMMWEHNILITPAIYPAVAMHRNLVRFSITASNTEAEIDQAITALQAVRKMVLAKRDTAQLEVQG